MKRILILFITTAIFLSLILSSCTAPIADQDLAPQIPDEREVYSESVFDCAGEEVHELQVDAQSLVVESKDIQKIKEELEILKEPITTYKSPIIKQNELLPFDMIGGIHQSGEFGEIKLNVYPQCDEFNPEFFRKYFYGYWETEHIDDVGNRYFMIIDDSENAINSTTGVSIEFYNGRIGWYGDNIIITNHIITGGTYAIYWIDINNPDIMYTSRVGGADFMSISVYYKSDIPINEPQDGYLSMLRVLEIALQYNIDYNMLVNIEEILDDGQKVFFSFPGGYFSASLYLILESPDKLILETSSLLVDTTFNDIEKITYIIEKINGEWVRTIEVD